MTEQPKTTAPKPPQDAWTMCQAILVGLHQARACAVSEWNAAMEAGNNKPSAPGTSKALQITQALDAAISTFEADMYNLARTSGLAMPEIKR